MKLELHSSDRITPGVKIMSELPRFTLQYSVSTLEKPVPHCGWSGERIQTKPNGDYKF